MLLKIFPKMGDVGELHPNAKNVRRPPPLDPPLHTMIHHVFIPLWCIWQCSHMGATLVHATVLPNFCLVFFYLKFVCVRMHEAMIFYLYFHRHSISNPSITQSCWDYTPPCSPLLPTSHDVVVATMEEEATGMSNNERHDDDDDEDDDVAVAADMEDNKCRHLQLI